MLETLSPLAHPVVSSLLYASAIIVSLFLVWHLALLRHLTVVEFFFLIWYFGVPILVTAITATHPKNASTIGTLAHSALIIHVPLATSISSLGLLFFCFFRIFFAYIVRAPSTFASTAFALQKSWGTPWGNSLLLFLLCFVTLALLIFDAELEPFKMRNVALANPTIRPLYLIAEQTVTFGVILSVAMFITTTKPCSFVFSVLFLACSIFTGTRSSTILAVLLGLLTSLGITASLRLFLTLALIVPFLLFAALLIEDLRAPEDVIGPYNLTQFDRLLFGNNFSEIRDFAWILSGWDGEFLGGQTLAAGLLSIVPSSMSDFRVDWSWGRVTLRLSGLSEITAAANSHAGLRPTIFGEWFLNFGLLGVIMLAIILAVLFSVAGSLLLRARQYAGMTRTSISILAGLLLLSAHDISISSGFFAIYFRIAVLSLGLVAASLLPTRPMSRTYPLEWNLAPDRPSRKYRTDEAPETCTV